MNSTAINKEIERLQKMINRKEEEIKEHKELMKMWQEKLNPANQTSIPVK